MKCPNCRSSRVRRAKRTIGEKIFLSMMLARPFRCEDCIHRYFGFLWASGSNLAGSLPDAKSLVYRSSTAALHSAGRRHHGSRRKVYTGASQPAPALLAAPATLLSSALEQPLRQGSFQSNGVLLRESPKPSTASFPEILGVILEMKQRRVSPLA